MDKIAQKNSMLAHSVQAVYSITKSWHKS